MTEKRFVDYFDKDHNYIIQDLQNEDEYQVGFVHCDEDVFLELVNKIAEENEQLQKKNDNLVNMIARVQYRADLIKDKNEQLKKILNELSDMLQFDVENEIKSYPVKLSEYLSNALKELQK